MSDKNDRAVGKAAATTPAGHSQPGEIDRFLGAAKRLAPLASGQAGRLVFALDATMSRQPSWDLACSLQGRMFEVAGQSGGLTGLAVGMATGGVVFAPFLAGRAAPVLGDWRLALAVVAVAVCSSVIPYGIEQVVLRRVRAATFAVLLALLPVCSAVVGVVVLRQVPNAAEVVGMLLVCGAIALTGRPDEAPPG